MINTLQNNYNSRLAGMFLINASFGIMCAWKIVDNFINPVTRSKIQVYSSGRPKELLSAIHPSQLPREYGGDFDLPKESWPPAFPPQTYRDEYVTMHMSENEFREEAAKKPLVMPSPALAWAARSGTRKQCGRVDRKTYYLRGGRVERRDSFNGVIEDEPVQEAKPEEKKLLAEPSAVAAPVVVPRDGKKEEPELRAAEIKIEIHETPVQEQQSKAKTENTVVPPPQKPKQMQQRERAKETLQVQNATELQAANSTYGSLKIELQARDFGRTKENETTKYKKAPSTKTCCACRIV